MEKDDKKITACELCDRINIECDRHHLIPKTRHKNKKNKKLFDRKEVKERLAWVCDCCHMTIHTEFTEKELEKTYNIIELLKNSPKLTDYIKWIKTKPNDFKLNVNRSQSRYAKNK
jgi:hypothetical protein